MAGHKATVIRETKDPITEEQRLAAACTVYPYKAAQMLRAKQEGNLNEVPDNDWFVGIFTFSRDSLTDYIESHPELIPHFLNSSLDQRGGFYATMEAVPQGYVVAWYDRNRTMTKMFTKVSEAATDYVLLFWRLLPLEGEEG